MPQTDAPLMPPRLAALLLAAGLAALPAALAPAGANPAAPAPGPEAANLLTIESDRQLADNRTGIITATGNVRIVDAARRLMVTARQAQYFSREGRLVLSGDVDAVDARGQRIRAERVVFLVSSERLEAEPVSGGQVSSQILLPRNRGPRPPLPLP